MNCTLDNLVFYVTDVDLQRFNRFVATLDQGEIQGNVVNVYRTIGKGASRYHHNISIGQGGGAIYISWKHNMKKEGLAAYDMRVEFNPSKSSSLHSWFWGQFKEIFFYCTKYVKQFDLAFDLPQYISNISVVSLTGKDRSLFKNTVYYGSSGKHARLKMYDKKKELKQVQDIDIPEENLTRIEYTVKYDDPIHLNFLKEIPDLSINEQYNVSNFNLQKNEGVIKASMLALQNGQMELKEFSRDYKKKIKKAFADMEKIDLDHEYRNAKKKILDEITLYIN